MKPEASSQKLKVESQKEPKEEVEVEISDDEKTIINLLEAGSPMDFNALKEQSNKRAHQK